MTASLRDVRHAARFALALALALGVVVALTLAGCRGDSGTGTSTASGSSATSAEAAPLNPEDQKLYQSLETRLSAIIAESSQRYAPLRYEYTEGLLKHLDQIERVVSGKVEGTPPRLLDKLDAEEERAHLRETVRRWEAKTGKSLRTEVDALNAEVAARKPGPAFHPEFQRKFSATFDDFIKVEVDELRERRNRAIHAATETLLAPHRAGHPEPVRRIQRLLDTPPYNLPTPTPPGAKP